MEIDSLSWGGNIGVLPIEPQELASESYIESAEDSEALNNNDELYLLIKNATKSAINTVGTTGNTYTKYDFRYEYGNGDYYDGYLISNQANYSVNQKIQTGSANSTGNTGVYTITNISSIAAYYSEVRVTSYYDADTLQATYGGYGKAKSVTSYGGYYGLGSEYGYANGATVKYFNNNTEADLRATPYSISTLQKFTFTYWYGNGDHYTGFGYASDGTYTSGQQITKSARNSTENIGFYQINTIETVTTEERLGLISITEYYDGDLVDGGYGGYGKALSVTNGYSNGLGSENGYAYGDYGRYFSSYQESDLRANAYSDPLIQKYFFTFYYGNGDFYSGEGYTAKSTYNSGQKITVSSWSYANAYYEITSAENITKTTQLSGSVSVTKYFDGDLTIGGFGGGGYASSVSASGTRGLGSEQGYAYGTGLGKYFNTSSDADLRTTAYYPQLAKFEFKYSYGNGDYYTGYFIDYADNYKSSDLITQQSKNSTGNYGTYEITTETNVAAGSKGYVTVLTYFDGDKVRGEYGGFGFAAKVSGYGYKGLGSEQGYAYKTAIGGGKKTAFDPLDDADLLTEPYYRVLNQYSFTYHYGNGDFYSGRYITDNAAITVGQKLLAKGANYYEITDKAETISDLFQTELVIIDEYFDGDLVVGGYGGWGFATGVVGSGKAGLGSEFGSTNFGSGQTKSFDPNSEIDLRDAAYTGVTEKWVAKIKDVGLKSSVSVAIADKSISYGDLESILLSVRDLNAIDSLELKGLKVLTKQLPIYTDNKYLSDIFSNITLQNDANRYWTGGQASRIDIGSLSANSGLATYDRIVDKWLYGRDLPSITVSGDAKLGFTGGFSYPYKIANGSLFVDGIDATDINQGYAGTCYFLAVLQAIAGANPDHIESMFEDNGNGTFGVRFYVDGEEKWVTVNSELPTNNLGRLVYAGSENKDPDGELWVALAEKAYAQFNETSLLNRDDSSNSYQTVEGGLDECLSQIGGVPYSKYLSFNIDTQKSVSYQTWLSYQKDVVDALNSGDYVWLGSYVDTYSYSGGMKYKFVGGHAFSIDSFSSETGLFTIRNPWGTAGTSWNPTFLASWNDIYNIYGWVSVGNRS